MARVSINMPENFTFITRVDVRIQNINRGNHLGNDQLVALLNEARLRFLPEEIVDPALEHAGMINADLAVIYKSEAFYGEQLSIEIAAADFHGKGFDLFYRVSAERDGRLVAEAKMAMLLMCMRQHRLMEFPEGSEAYVRDYCRHNHQ